VILFAFFQYTLFSNGDVQAGRGMLKSRIMVAGGGVCPASRTADWAGTEISARHAGRRSGRG